MTDVDTRRFFWKYVNSLKVTIQSEGLRLAGDSVIVGKYPEMTSKAMRRVVSKSPTWYHKWWCGVYTPNKIVRLFTVKLTVGITSIKLRLMDPDADKLLSHTSVNLSCDPQTIDVRLRLDIDHAIRETAGILDRMAWEVSPDATSSTEDSSNRSEQTSS